MRPNAKAMLVRIERERRTIELTAMRAALRIGTQARIHALAAYRTGHDPAQAVRDVLLGSQRLGLPGAVPLIVDSMVVSHLTGRKRTGLNVAQARPKRLARGAFDEAIEFLMRRLDLDDTALDALRQQYHAQALRVTTENTNGLERAIQQTVVETTQAGLGVRDGMKALRQTFVSEGYVPQSDYQLQQVFRTQSNLAYSAGREASLRDPAIQEILWGFEYVAIDDDRTTELCSSLNGMRRPKEDPIWDRFTPPNHYNCRSTKLEIFKDEQVAASTVVPDVQPIAGFAFNPGNVFRDTIRPAA